MWRKRGSQQSPDSPTVPAGIGAEGIWYVVMSLLAAVVIFTGVVSAASVSPRFCSPCHASASGALHSSKHAKADCDSCHLSGGVLGIVENRLRIVSMVAGAPFAFLEPANGSGRPIGNDRCLKCHAAMVNKTIQVKGLRMNHRTPQEKGVLCVECHRGSAHPGKSYKGVSYDMGTCMRCHDAGIDNLSTCTTCHPEGESQTVRSPAKTSWQVTHGEKWQQTHGMGDLKTCNTCHGPKYCVTCHHMQLPHKEDFISTHGKETLARATGTADCVMCHKGSACDNCHGMKMPHPTGFVAQHKATSKKLGDKVCMRCHTKASCEACHRRHIHPGIPTDLLKQLKARPVTAQ